MCYLISVNPYTTANVPLIPSTHVTPFLVLQDGVEVNAVGASCCGTAPKQRQSWTRGGVWVPRHKRVGYCKTTPPPCSPPYSTAVMVTGFRRMGVKSVSVHRVPLSIVSPLHLPSQTQESCGRWAPGAPGG